MGDGVNIASRMEGLNKQFRTSICISESIHERVADRVVARPIQRLAVKGRTGTFLVHELLGIAGSDDPESRVDARNLELCKMTAAAMAHLDAGRFAEARDQYQCLLDAFPDDGVALTMRDFAAQQANGYVGAVKSACPSAATC